MHDAQRAVAVHAGVGAPYALLGRAAVPFPIPKVSMSYRHAARTVAALGDGGPGALPGHQAALSWREKVRPDFIESTNTA